ncbi:MAG TPA: hypothetical protein VHN77_10190 [Phycisphaerales bacterium]|nr:hypothetical protein [Phycisphaerales bacterium]
MRLGTACVLTSLALTCSAVAQSTALTYQGELTSGGQAASVPHDLRFRLFDAASGGTQVGATLCRNDVHVTEGRFSTTIDFGQQFAPDAPRFVEVEVRADNGADCSSLGGFIVLSPRTVIAPSPRAVHAYSASALAAPDGSPNDALTVGHDGKVGIGTTAPGATAPSSVLDIFGGAALVSGTGDQADLMWFWNERPWVFRQEGVGAAAALKLQSAGGARNFVVQTDGFTGLGTTAPLAKVDVRGDIRLGQAGQYLAAAGEENLRVLRGTVGGGGAGTVVAGSGFSVQWLGNLNGVYIITFHEPFAAAPSLTITPEWSSTTKVAMTDGVSPQSARIEIFARTDGSSSPCDFSFVAVGPR